MEFVCPTCNGMISYIFKCPHCSKQMKNLGKVTDFLDDYSPYLAMDITEKVDGAPANQCVHLFHCRDCNYDKRKSINKVMI